MPKSLILPIASVLGIGLLFGILWFVSYALPTDPPARVEIADLDGRATIYWNDLTHINLDLEEPSTNMYTALGYVHGIANGWSSLLLRQAAIGRLGLWFEADVSDLDRVSRTLDISGVAKKAMVAMPRSEQMKFHSYANGMNAALQSNRVQRNESLLLFDVKAEAWEAWHSVAIEILVAWLDASQQANRTSWPSGTDLTEFLSNSTSLASWLRMGDFDESYAWVRRAGSNPDYTSYHRIVTGASAERYLQYVTLSQQSMYAATVATVPGTLAFPYGSSASGEWVRFLNSKAVISRSNLDSLAASVHFDRVLFADGSEELVQSTFARAALLFSVPDGPAGEVFKLEWAGLDPNLVSSGWMRSLEFSEVAFAGVWSGDGMLIPILGEETILGSPRHNIKLPSGSIAGNSRWTEYIADRLRSSDVDDPQTWTRDTFSPWAAGIAPLLVRQADRFEHDSEEVTRAIQYLRNWDFHFDASSIAGSIFDRWAAIHLREEGYIPQIQFSGPDNVDSTRVVRITSPTRSIQHLIRAVRNLTDNFGNDLRRWRWEDTQVLAMTYPVWSDAKSPKIASRSILRRRFSTQKLSHGGHPSALRWGPSSTFGRSAPSQVYESLGGGADWTDIELYNRINRGRPLDDSRHVSELQPDGFVTQIISR